MNYEVEYDKRWNRHVGAGVVGTCDHPDCNTIVYRSLTAVCCAGEPFGGYAGCGLYFCEQHQDAMGMCIRCQRGMAPYKPKPEHPAWAQHIMSATDWTRWRSLLTAGAHQYWTRLAKKCTPEMKAEAQQHAVL